MSDDDSNVRVLSCDRCGGEGQPDHACPYNQDIHCNNTTCNCCESCEEDCGDNI